MLHASCALRSLCGALFAYVKGNTDPIQTKNDYCQTSRCAAHAVLAEAGKVAQTAGLELESNRDHRACSESFGFFRLY